MASLPTETITSMTSVFTPASGCANSWTFEGSSYNSVSGGLLMQNLNYNDFNTACFPPDFGAYGRAPSSIQVYSPGACPSGYNAPGAQNFGGTTTLTCCPESFSYGSTYSSIDNFGTSSVLFMGCISSFSGTTTVPARSGNSELSSTTIYATGAPITMWGQPITVEYVQKDLSLFGSATDTRSSAPTSTNRASASLNLGSSSGGTSSSSTTSTLSTAAKAGIAIGIALVVILLLALAAFFVMRRRKNSRLRKSPTYYNDDSKEPFRQKMGNGDADGDRMVSELSQENEYQRRELDGSETQITSSMGAAGFVDKREKEGRARSDGGTYELE